MNADYTDQADMCMGKPPAPRQVPSGGRELGSRPPLGTWRGQREALPPMH